MELRFQNMNLESDDEGLVVSGYVNKTEQESKVLGRTKKFVEVIKRGVFQRAINNAQHAIEFLAEHDSTRILASTSNNSLELREDESGLFMSARITPTSWGKDFYELIKTGLYKDMSFGFSVVEQKWEQRIDGTYKRIITEIELHEVSVVKIGAYDNTAISARGIDIEDVEIPTNITGKEGDTMQKEFLELLQEFKGLMQAVKAKLEIHDEENELTDEEKAKAKAEKEAKDAEEKAKVSEEKGEEKGNGEDPDAELTDEEKEAKAKKEEEEKAKADEEKEALKEARSVLEALKSDLV